MKTLLATAILATSTIATAGSLEQYNTAMAEVDATYASLNGVEVEGTGDIGYDIFKKLEIKVSGAKNFGITAFGNFNATLDAGRKARKSIEGCEVGWGSGNCQVDFKAELSVKGRSVTFNIYEIGEVKRK